MVEQLLTIAGNLGWAVTPPFSDDMGDIEFQKYSPAGQDFSFDLTATTDADDLIEDLEGVISTFDPLERAFLWVKNGHGVNGAPDDPRDIIKDMEECKEMMRELLLAWKNEIK